jgi:hypothetical protein
MDLISKVEGEKILKISYSAKKSVKFLHKYLRYIVDGSKLGLLFAIPQKLQTVFKLWLTRRLLQPKSIINKEPKLCSIAPLRVFHGIRWVCKTVHELSMFVKLVTTVLLQTAYKTLNKQAILDMESLCSEDRCTFFLWFSLNTAKNLLLAFSGIINNGISVDCRVFITLFKRR